MSDGNGCQEKTLYSPPTPLIHNWDETCREHPEGETTVKMIIGPAICAILLVTSISASYTQTARNKTSQANARESDIARGKYLVEEVAKCAECHTPRDAQNQLDSDRWLQGAPIWITSVKPAPTWADRAPTLAGFPGYSDKDGFDVLEKGIGANGEAIRPPMHIYHLKHEDAVAIIAYLRSLPSGPK